MGFERVVVVVLERLGNGFRNDGVCGKVHDRFDAVLLEQRLDELLIPGIADYQLTANDGLAKTFAQVVDDENLTTHLAQLTHDVTADIAGPTGDEYCAGHAWNPQWALGLSGDPCAH